MPAKCDDRALVNYAPTGELRSRWFKLLGDLAGRPSGCEHLIARPGFVCIDHGFPIRCAECHEAHVALAHASEPCCSQCGEPIEPSEMFSAVVNHPLDSPAPVMPVLPDGTSGHCDDVTLLALICLRCAFNGRSVVT